MNNQEIIYLVKLNKNPTYKFAVVFEDGKKILFGKKPYSDMLQHKNEARKNRYILRHIKNEDWTKKGIRTRGFWSRWILWNLSSLEKSIKDIEDRFNVNIIYYPNL